MDADKIKIDKEKCIACGTCTIIAPGSYKIGDSGKAEVIDPPTDDDAKILEAEENCPVGAISIE